MTKDQMKKAAAKIKVETLLLKELEPLRVLYIEKTTEYAHNYFALLKERSQWREVDWCKYFGVEPRMANAGTNMEFLSFPSGFYNTRNGRYLDAEKSEIARAMRQGEPDYVSAKVKEAQLHYEQSVTKLAERLVKFGINPNAKLSAKTTFIGANINCFITDGTVTAHAYTIVASGPIQRPHYRYLIQKVKS